VPSRRSEKTLIWVHAVSVGEVIAATPMVKRLQLQYPNYEFCITTTTPTGSERVRVAFGNEVLHYYLPYDLPSLLTFFIRAIKPKMLIVMETELWPNVIEVCSQKNIPIVLANGRMSKSSARGYKKLSWLTEPMFSKINFIAAQSKMDAERFIYLGAHRSRVQITGSVKFDTEIDEMVIARRDVLLRQLQCEDRKVVVFASTHPGEDEQILPMIKRLSHISPEFLAIVVPRHPERFNDVAHIAEQLHIAYVRLSSGEPCVNGTQMILGDTMGDMLALYGLADVAFVGGTLVTHGGHNFLEAAAWELPILSGPSLYNFQDIAKLLIKSGGLIVMHDHLDIERNLQLWLSGRLDFSSMGKASKKVLLANRGALDNLMAVLHEFLI
jgi:3-deoxy-D-manno-octulosonic-acid transferase